MRGRFIHNEVLLRPFAEHFRALGASTSEEHYVNTHDVTGFIDLFVRHDNQRICVEAELTPVRVPNDVAKAIAISATLLIIVVPTKQVAEAASRVASEATSDQPFAPVWILPLGRAITRVQALFPLISKANDGQQTRAAARSQQQST